MPQENDTGSNPRAASTRIGAVTAKTLAGQIAHDLRRGPQPAYVDGSRTHLNRVLVKPVSPARMRAICQERRARRTTQRAMKSSAAVATRGIITFGAEAARLFEALTPAQQDAAFRELAEAIAARLATSLHGLVVHRDEATVHAHYQLAAYNAFGEPLAKTTSPRVLAELQDLTAEVMARHCPGIERGRSYGERLAAGADYAETVHRSVAELHRTLPADLAAKRLALADLAEAERAAAARVEEMKGRVEKLEEKAELSEQEAKRLDAYERRLVDREAELDAAQVALEAARADVDRLAELARADRQAEEDRLERERALLAEQQRQVECDRATAQAASEVSQAEARRMAELARADRRAERAEVDRERARLAEERQQLERERRELQAERRDVAGLKASLRRLCEQVAHWLRRAEALPRGMKAEGRALVLEAAVKLAPRPEALPEPPEEDDSPQPG